MESNLINTKIRDAVQLIKAAILRSQARSVQYINQEQLSLYFGIGRYVSEHSRNGFWGTGAIDNISKQLKSELPGLRGFSSENIKLMRRFYETWKAIEPNSVVGTTEIVDDALKSLPFNSVVETTELQSSENKEDIIHGLRLTKDEQFPIVAFLNISFTHHVAIMRYAKEYEERKYYIQLAYQQRLKADDLESMIKANVYSHRDALPNNFFKTIPDKALALRTIQMFKDEYLLDYINVEEIDVSDPMDIDEKVIETKIVMNIKNFIMTFGRSFTLWKVKMKLLTQKRRGRMNKVKWVRLGDHIEQCDERNDALRYGLENVMGMIITKEIISTKANLSGIFVIKERSNNKYED